MNCAHLDHEIRVTCEDGVLLQGAHASVVSHEDIELSDAGQQPLGSSQLTCVAYARSEIQIRGRASKHVVSGGDHQAALIRGQFRCNPPGLSGIRPRTETGPAMAGSGRAETRIQASSEAGDEGAHHDGRRIRPRNGLHEANQRSHEAGCRASTGRRSASVAGTD